MIRRALLEAVRWPAGLLLLAAAAGAAVFLMWLPD